MARFIKDHKETKGKAPGSLILIGKQKMDRAEIDLMEFDAHNFAETQRISIKDAFLKIKKGKVTWINVYGIHDLNLMKEIGQFFNLHSLLLEDILNTDHHPKYEEIEKHYVFILKMLDYDEESKMIKAEQITLILGESYVLTFQERYGDVFNQVRERIRNKKGLVRFKNGEYLLYALLDTIVDNYMFIIESIGRQIEDMEDRILRDAGEAIVEDIYSHKTELNFLRKVVRPLREIMLHVMKSENPFMHNQNIHYMNDLNDHVIQITDTIELYNNLLTDQLNAYNSNVSNRMNEVMKVLTIFASIFIPLTFIAGIYGMNFEFIPELKFKYAYPVFWLVVLMIGAGLLVFFRRKRWL